jgi:ATP-binding protein involved in chromosome partitioning
LLNAGMVEEVRLEGTRANIGIRLTTPLCPSKATLRERVTEVVGRLTGIESVEVTFTASVARKFGPLPDRLQSVRNVIAVSAGKGGVGKSTVSVNLASALSLGGARVGILDADVFGPSIPQMMGEPQVPPNLEGGSAIVPAVHHGMKVLSVAFFVERGAAVMWRGPMIHKLLTQFMEDVEWGELDYLVVDLPPGTGDTQLSLAQLVPVTGALVVTTPQEVSILDVEKAVAMWKKVEVPVVGVVENMSTFICPACGHHEPIFASGGGRRLAEREGLPFLGEIPIESKVRSSGDAGLPIVLASPDSSIAKVFEEMASRVACALSVLNLPDPGTAKRSSKLSILK